MFSLTHATAAQVVQAAVVGGVGSCGKPGDAEQIRTSITAIFRMRHPLVGYLDVTQQVLTSSGTSGQTLIACTASAGSPSSEALRNLVDLA